MDYEPAEYRKLVLKQFPPRALRETAEGKYWKRFASPVNAQQVSQLLLIPALYCLLAACMLLVLRCTLCHIQMRTEILALFRLAPCPILASHSSTLTTLLLQAQLGCVFRRHSSHARQSSHCCSAEIFMGKVQWVLQVIIYDAVTRQVRRQFTRFKDKAYCGTFRSDNKLLVAGGEDGIVQVASQHQLTLERTDCSLIESSTRHHTSYHATQQACCLQCSVSIKLHPTCTCDCLHAIRMSAAFGPCQSSVG